MDEKFTREKKSSRRRVEPQKQTKAKTYGSKLKNDLSRNEAMRKKLRTGKAECSETLQEKKKIDKLRKQGRNKTYAEAATLAKARHQMANHNEDENAGVEAVDTGLDLAEGAMYSRKAQPKSRKSNGYGKKLHQKSPFEEVNGAKGTGAAVTKEGTNQLQKNLMKKEIQRQAYDAGAKEAAHGFGSFTAKFVDKAEDLAGKLAEGVIETVKSHPLLCLLAVGILLLVVGLSSCTSTIGLAAHEDEFPFDNPGVNQPTGFIEITPPVYIDSLKADQPIEITAEGKKDEAEKKGEDPAQDGKQDEKEKPSKRKSVKKQIAEKKDKTPRTKKPKEVDTKKLGEAI